MVDKPRRRKKSGPNWLKVAAAVIGAIIIVAIGYAVYETYIYKPPPVYATIYTTDGSFEVELLPSCAPATVANFVSLAKSGFYDNLVWHRIVAGFVIQTGDSNTRNGLNSTRSSWGLGGSNNTVPLEVTACPDLSNTVGTVAMARKGNFTSGLDTGTSQFYINLANNTSLDTHYTIFGRVIANMSVVIALARTPICQPPIYPTTWINQPIHPVFITRIVVSQTP